MVSNLGKDAYRGGSLKRPVSRPSALAVARKWQDCQDLQSHRTYCLASESHVERCSFGLREFTVKSKDDLPQPSIFSQVMTRNLSGQKNPFLTLSF